MSNLKKKKTCPGSPKLPNRNQTCKTNTPSTSSISKYFKNKTDPSCTELFETPYKNSLSKIQVVNCSDDDFRTPPMIKKVPKILSKKEPKRKSRKTSSKQKSNSTIDSIFKRTKDNFEHLDVHPEHLQMALALSRSTYLLENPDKGKYNDDDDTLPTFLSADNIPKIGTTLEKYGFRSKRPKLETEFKIDHLDVKRKKNSRFRFVTPTLLMRSTEEREALVQSKISLILSDQQGIEKKEELPCQLCSEILSQMLVNENRIMGNNSLGVEELSSCNFYVGELNISRSENTCGCLLKSWSSIPGRDVSPQRSKFSSSNDTNVAKEHSSDGTSSNITVHERATNPDISHQNPNSQNNVTPSDICKKDADDVHLDHVGNIGDKCELKMEQIGINIEAMDVDYRNIPNKSLVGQAREKEYLNNSILGIDSCAASKYNSNSLLKMEETIDNNVTNIMEDMDCDNIRAGHHLPSKISNQSFKDEQNLKTSTHSNEISKYNPNSSGRCVSPDLFDSDYESFSPKQKTPPKLFKSCKGIDHFESFIHDSETLSQEFLIKTTKEELYKERESSNLDTEPFSPADSDCTVNYDLNDIENVDFLSEDKFANVDNDISQSEEKNSTGTTGTSNMILENHRDSVCRKKDEDEYMIDLTQSSEENDSAPKQQEDVEVEPSQKYGAGSDILSQVSVENDNSDIELPSFREYLRNSMHGDMLLDLTQELSDDDAESLDASQNSTVSDTGEEIKLTRDDSFKEEIKPVNIEQKEDRVSLLSEPGTSYNRSDLNITEYIHHMLNTQDTSSDCYNRSKNSISRCLEDSIEVNPEDFNHSNVHNKKDLENTHGSRNLDPFGESDSGNKTMSSNTSEESIIIYDEELNYSSFHSKKQNYDVADNFHKSISDSTEEKQDLLVHYRSEGSIVISDEELSSSKDNFNKNTKCKKFYNLSDDEDMSKIYIDDLDKANFELREKYGIVQSQAMESSERNYIDNRNQEDNGIKNQETSEEAHNSQPQTHIEFMEYHHNLEEYNVATDQLSYYNEDNDQPNVAQGEDNNPQSRVQIEYQHNLDECNIGRDQSSYREEIVDIPKILQNRVDFCNSEKKNPSTLQKKRNTSKEKVDTIQSLPHKHSTPVQKFTIKTRDVTPEPEYDRMTSPEIVKELKKIGVKALKRNRGIQFLKYIYEYTHPIAGSYEAKKICKIGKENKLEKQKRKMDGIRTSSKTSNDLSSSGNIELIDEHFLNSLNPDNFILERKVSSKISSCHLPLQVAWHNFVTCNRELRENILTYEPLQLEVIYSMLKEETGCKYHIEDLITYLDQKCITFRTSQSGSRTKKKL